MSEKVNVKKALSVFNTIITEGRRSDDKYVLNGLTAYTDFDGYTVTIRNDYVRLNIFFHNKISFKCSNNKEKALFLEKINSMSRKNNA